MKIHWIMTFLLSMASLPAFAGLSFNQPLLTPDGLDGSLETMETTATEHWGPHDYWSDSFDDFRYSRRLRRFHRNSAVDVYWSYYDPYFTSDVYYVIGTSYWDNWNTYYDPWRYRYDAYNVSFGWNTGGFGTTVVYTSGWNPWGYSPYYYYGGLFHLWLLQLLRPILVMATSLELL